jgi:hypothetical protein
MDPLEPVPAHLLRDDDEADDMQSGGIQNPPDHGQADEEKQGTTDEFTQHVNG